MIVVADTSPLNYLILIGHIDVLEAIYGEVVIPPAVQDEMLDPLAPPSVRSWIKNPPHWLEVRTPAHINIPLDPDLDAGEREAIALAHNSGQNGILLIDERVGRKEATRLGLKVTGTLGVLEEADKRGLLHIREAIELLRATSFKVADSVLKQFVDIP
jgi:predicted nucleic acid-binding protein